MGRKRTCNLIVSLSNLIFTQCLEILGYVLGLWLRKWAKKEVAVSIPNGIIGIFLTYFFRPHYVPGVDSASNRNEYQEKLLGAKGGRCLRLTTECLGTLEASYSWISKGLSGPVIEYL
jgi:hypothetical protein